MGNQNRNVLVQFAYFGIFINTDQFFTFKISSLNWRRCLHYQHIYRSASEHLVPKPISTHIPDRNLSVCYISHGSHLSPILISLALCPTFNTKRCLRTSLTLGTPLSMTTKKNNGLYQDIDFEHSSLVSCMGSLH